MRVLGEDPWNNTALFRRVGYCPEQDSLYEDMDAPGFVSYLLRLRGFCREPLPSLLNRVLDVRKWPILGKAGVLANEQLVLSVQCYLLRKQGLARFSESTIANEKPGHHPGQNDGEQKRSVHAPSR